MTVSDLPVADASPSELAYSPRVSARARARVAATHGDGKKPSIFANVGRPIVADLRGWWLWASRPPSLRAWRRAQKPNVARVPGDSAALRRAWTADNWTSGLIFRLVSTVLLLLAGACAWLAGHPLRRWSALILIFGFVTWMAN